MIAVAIAKLGLLADAGMFVKIALQTAWISLILCFFNLLPIPPLYGSHVIKNLIGMSEETYFRLCQYGFLAVIIAIQVPAVRNLVFIASKVSFELIAGSLGIPRNALR